MKGLFLLDLSVMRAGVRHWRLVPDYSPAYGSFLLWRLCPECLWLRPSYDTTLQCNRPPGESVHYGFPGGALKEPCMVRTIPLATDIGDALWAALSIGGINALVAMVAELTPEQVGLPTAVDRWRKQRDQT